jgi:hypothetical protein
MVPRVVLVSLTLKTKYVVLYYLRFRWDKISDRPLWTLKETVRSAHQAKLFRKFEPYQLPCNMKLALRGQLYFAQRSCPGHHITVNQQISFYFKRRLTHYDESCTCFANFIAFTMARRVGLAKPSRTFQFLSLHPYYQNLVRQCD